VRGNLREEALGAGHVLRRIDTDALEGHGVAKVEILKA